MRFAASRARWIASSSVFASEATPFLWRWRDGTDDVAPILQT
jgi:hypothetical protein